MVWCGIIAGAALMQVYRLVTRRYSAPSHLLFLSIASTLIAEWALLGVRDGRYLLPLSALLVALAGVEVSDIVIVLCSARTAWAAAFALLLVGAVSMREFRDFNYLWTNPPNRWTEAGGFDRLSGT